MDDIVLIKNNRVNYGNVIESKVIGNSSKMENFEKKNDNAVESECYCIN